MDQGASGKAEEDGRGFSVEPGRRSREPRERWRQRQRSRAGWIPLHRQHHSNHEKGHPCRRQDRKGRHGGDARKCVRVQQPRYQRVRSTDSSPLFRSFIDPNV